MTEERSCATCKHGEGTFCKSDDGLCSNFVTHQHWEPKNPQPIQKAPSFQMTEEEARKLFIDIGISASVGIAMEGAREHGYIRKSELVELVEEAEKIWAIYYSDSEYIPSNINYKLYQALQALKKDHPEFGGKK